MRKIYFAVLALVAICLLATPLAAAQGGNPPASTKESGATSGKGMTAAEQTTESGGNVEAQIKKLEQDWAHAVVKNGAAAVDQYEADDIVSTDPSGRVTDKAQDKQDLSSGDLKFQSLEPSDLKVRVYGNTAVATGLVSLKGTYKGQDISGNYRFTDTWVKRNGKWQAVASQATKVQQQ